MASHVSGMVDSLAVLVNEFDSFSFEKMQYVSYLFCTSILPVAAAVR